MARQRAKSTTPPGTKTIASNRRARHDYSVLDTVEAGLVLSGSEVKALRHGLVQIADAFARYHDGEMWIEGMHISPYPFAQGFGAHDPNRRRKLLMHRDEINRLQSRIAQEKLALVPLSLYFKDGRAKVELALGKGRQKADKRQAIAERDSQLEVEREMGRRRKYGD
jgi:SsrA-binding protein